MYPFLHSGITILTEAKNTNMKIMASWRKVHWSDESRFLLHVTDGRVRVWRQPNTVYAERNIVETVPFGGGLVMVWDVYHMNVSLTSLQ